MKKQLLLSSLSIIAIGGYALGQNSLEQYVVNSDFNQYTVIVDATNSVNVPVDLDFHPTRANELWVLNQDSENTGASSVIISDAGEPGQSSEFRRDGNAWHFMALASSMAFSDNGNWATAQGIWSANHNNVSFTGPSLWSSDLNIYAVVGTPPTQGFNGSHLDMIHQSPYGMGIASEGDNVFWVYDGENGNICRYDFGDDHGPGQDDHSDGRIKRYSEVQVQMSGDIPSHMVLDQSSGWLYICDVGSGKILRMDINSGNVKNSLTPNWGESLAEYSQMENVDWEVYITGFNKPCGIDIYDNYLIITNNGNGEIVIMDISDDANPELVGKINPGSQYVGSITGVKVGPKGKIWFTDKSKNHVVRIDNDAVFPTGVNSSTLEDPTVAIYPNPASAELNISLSRFTKEHNVMAKIVDVTGKEVDSFLVTNGNNSVNVSNLSKGVYFLTITDSDGLFFSEKVVIK